LKASPVPNLESRVHFLKMDVSQEASIGEAASELKNQTRSLHNHLSVNLIGPILVMKHFSSLFSAPSKDSAPGTTGKAGLNQAMRTASVELARKGILTVSLHPGTVDTDLSRNFVKNAPHVIPPDEAAHLLWTVIRNLKDTDNGGFFDQNGKPIIW
ncbi:hypothetical protein BC829DRAFT_391282, partial [Chytridium lagenaria]